MGCLGIIALCYQVRRTVEINLWLLYRRPPGQHTFLLEGTKLVLCLHASQEQLSVTAVLRVALPATK